MNSYSNVLEMGYNSVDIEWYSPYYSTTFIEQQMNFISGFQRPGNGWVMWI